VPGLEEARRWREEGSSKGRRWWWRRLTNCRGDAWINGRKIKAFVSTVAPSCALYYLSYVVQGVLDLSSVRLLRRRERALMRHYARRLRLPLQYCIAACVRDVPGNRNFSFEITRARRLEEMKKESFILIVPSSSSSRNLFLLNFCRPHRA
jgi:hypothetical protein